MYQPVYETYQAGEVLLDRSGNPIPVMERVYTYEDQEMCIRDSWNGPDGIPGTEDDELVHPGLDGKLETGDDWVENGHNYPETNLRPGPDGVFGTEDDEVYWNGPDGIPGTEDDELVHPVSYTHLDVYKRQEQR